MYRQLALLVLTLGFCLGLPASAANIVWVSFHPADNTPSSGAAGTGFTTATDKGYTDLLKANGYNVTRYVTTATPDAALLNAADLVIISRSVGSANYQDAAATTWNTTITAPMVILGGYAIRQSRLGFSTGNTIPDTTGDIRLTAVDPAHQVFAGIALTGGAMVNPYAGVMKHPSSGATMRGISIVTEAPNANGKVLATVAPGSAHSAIGAMVIAEWPAGVTVTHAGGAGTDVLAGPRMVFLTGSRETDGVNSETAGYYDLYPDGAKMFINAVRYMLGEFGDTAANPNPQNEAVDVPRDTTLSWKAADSATAHDVYFGTSLADVTDASRDDPRGVLVSRGQAETTYVPAEPLQYATVYYWRVDEVSTAADSGVARGEIWSFTAEPVSYPIQNIKATASSALTGMGPENTVNGSGLTDGTHSTREFDMWFSAKNAPEPAWIQFEFDQAYKLEQLLVWNSNQSLESIIGLGVKDVTIEYSQDGVEWAAAGDFEFTQAPGDITCAAQAFDLNGIVAKFVKFTMISNWGGYAAQYSLSEVQFLYLPVRPWEPAPASGAMEVPLDTLLTWRSGREAASHRVYFSQDQQAVADGTVSASTVADNSFDPGRLTLGTTYYWRVDEVNEAMDPSLYEGAIWSFTTQEYEPIDDFEAYNDTDNYLYDTWIDGYTDHLSNSFVGYMDAIAGTFGERTIVYDGGQSMPFEYNNVDTPYFSEAYREFSPTRDWTADGADTFLVNVRGNAPGFAEMGDGSIVMGGIGADIWNATDEFHFAFKQLSGNGTIIAKVESLTRANEWTKVGLMIRESVDPAARFAAVYATPDYGVRYQARLTNAGAAVSDSAVATAEQIAMRAPVWLKIERSGNDFNAYYSTNGTTWTSMVWNPQSITLTGTICIGLAVTSHNATDATIARFSSVTVTGATGAWQTAQIGVAQPTSTPDTLYVVVQDNSGKSKAVAHPDPMVTVTPSWQQWEIPLSEFTAAGVKLTRVQKLYIGVGNRANPTKGGAGHLYIDGIGFGHPAQ
ncbi:MAG TPA: discoidin domain-containing protein [Sedimentisphaerales bacterium]|nr:discoidin domain-containing protein [Sedimentisphaerales bacterium]